MEQEEDIRYKAFYDFYVDIFGGIIPGLLFLFSVIMSMGIPFIYMLLLFNKEMFNNGNNPEVSTKIDLLLTNVFQGWFWVIFFLMLVILAYVIGHIFYRMEIKDPDQKDFVRQQKENIKKIITEYTNNEKKQNFYLTYQGKGIEISYKQNESTNENIQPECNKIKHFEYYYFLFKFIEEMQFLLNTNEDKDEKTNNVILESYFGTELISFMKDWNTIIEKVWGEGQDSIKGNTIDIIRFIEIAKKYEESIPLWTKILSSKNLLESKEYAILKKFVLPENNEKIIDDYVNLINKNKSWNNFQYDEENPFMVLFCILYNQAECACEIKENCLFPYRSYYKYLLKRGFTELSKYANWSISNIRSKNKINKYKLYVQTRNPKVFFILTKNESHIRMASSSWHVSRVLILPIYLFLGVIVALLLFHNNPLCERNALNTLLERFCILIIPVLNIFLLRFLNKKITGFIHYQRLREIFYTINIYDYCSKNEEEGKFAMPHPK